MNEVLKRVYENLIAIVLKDFNPDEIEEVKQAYQDYLVSRYTSSLILSDNAEKLIKQFTDIEKLKWEEETKQIKEAILLKDEQLEKLGYLSNLALKYATARLMNKTDEINITPEIAEKYIAEMQDYAQNVRSFNKNMALNYLSEGIMDFNFALGLSNESSLRVGRLR